MNREDRKREYEYFSAEQHQAVVLAYLFQGMTVAQAVAELQQAACADYENLIAILCGREVSEFKCAEDIQSETALDYRTAREGRRELIYTTRYERSPILRKRAIQIHGTTCMACAFNFYNFYGERGKDYIEVHHLTPLSTLEEEFEINPATDMAVVCSNCHRMIHRERNNILSIDELKQIINR